MRTALRLAVVVVMASTAQAAFARCATGDTRHESVEMKVKPAEVKPEATETEELGAASAEPGGGAESAKVEPAKAEAQAEAREMRRAWEERH